MPVYGLQTGVSSFGVLETRARLFGVHFRAPDFLETPEKILGPSRDSYTMTLGSM